MSAIENARKAIERWEQNGRDMPLARALDKLIAEHERVLGDLAKMTESRNEWASRMMELASITQRAEAAEAALAGLAETEAVERFKAEWHRADAEGDSGNRVRRGLSAALGSGSEGSDD